MDATGGDGGRMAGIHRAGTTRKWNFIRTIRTTSTINTVNGDMGEMDAGGGASAGAVLPE